VRTAEPDTDSFGANEARLLLSLLAANVLRAGAEGDVLIFLQKRAA
jgi:hypothetical protein